MKRLLQLLFYLSLAALFSSCQKEYSLEGDNTSGFDPDAWVFIQNAGIIDNTQESAINNLVIQLKLDSLWGKFYAIYPMVGGTASTTKWNLKDPRDLDAAYRLTFYGSPIYSPEGVLLPTLDDYADTHFRDNFFAYNDASISYYSTTQNSISGYDMGCNDSVSPYNELAIYHAFDATVWFGFYGYFYTPANTVGLFMLSSNINDVKSYYNGAVTGQMNTTPANAYTGFPILLGKSGEAVNSGQRRCSFATIGQGFSDNQAQLLFNVVQNFEISLGR